jgi:hypothetical protein
VKIVNAILGLLTLVVLAAAVFVIPFVGHGGTLKDRIWQAVGVVLFLLAVLAVIKKPRFSILFLLLSCAFFFVSCTANYHWDGG